MILRRLSSAGVLVTLGIVFGDLGTSPLYVMKAIVKGGAEFNELLIFGSLSCIFWTLTLQTTTKYIIIALRVDNKGEGGILCFICIIEKKIFMGSSSDNDWRCRIYWLMELLHLRLLLLLPLRD